MTQCFEFLKTEAVNTRAGKIAGPDYPIGAEHDEEL